MCSYTGNLNTTNEEEPPPRSSGEEQELRGVCRWEFVRSLLTVCCELYEDCSPSDYRFPTEGTLRRLGDVYPPSSKKQKCNKAQQKQDTRQQKTRVNVGVSFP